MTATDSANQHLIVTAFWEVNSGEEGAVAELLKDFLPQAQREPGVKAFQIHQNVTKPREFFFYEVFAGEAAFADHQQTDHFKNIIVGQAIPKLAKRERQQFRFILVRTDIGTRRTQAATFERKRSTDARRSTA